MRTFKPYYPPIYYSESEFPEKVNSRLNWFFFFLGFPMLEILGNSVTFYLFLSIIFVLREKIDIKFHGKKIFLSFLFLIFVSTLTAPFLERSPGLISKIIILVQFTYWIFLVFFIIKFKNKFNLIELSKYLFYSLIFSSFFFFIFPVGIETPIISIKLGQERNAFVFNMLCIAPFTFYYLKSIGGKIVCYIAMLLYIYLMLLTNGRSGSILIVVEMLLILSLLTTRLSKLIRFAMLFFLLLFSLSESDFFQPILVQIAENVKELNPRLSGLILDEGDGSIERDKSWGQRKLMIDKGLEIFKEHPIIGIGINNFKYYDADLASHSSPKFYYLVQSKEWYNGRSAHNSYIQILAELGIIGIVLFGLILIIPIFIFVKKFIFNLIDFNDIPLICLFVISIYFYAISSFMGAIPWLVIGFSWFEIQKDLKLRL